MMGQVQLEGKEKTYKVSPARHTIMIRLLQILWIILILRYELGVFDDVLRDCQWPVPEVSTVSHFEGLLWLMYPRQTSTRAQTAHITILTDPHVNLPPSNLRWNETLAQFIVDLNLRKSWRVVLERLQPRSDAIVMLGDLMHGAREDIADYE